MSGDREELAEKVAERLDGASVEDVLAMFDRLGADDDDDVDPALVDAVAEKLRNSPDPGEPGENYGYE